MEVAKYLYRESFGLTAAEMEEEPIDDFFTNLQIRAFIEDKRKQDKKHGLR